MDRIAFTPKRRRLLGSHERRQWVYDALMGAVDRPTHIIHGIYMLFRTIVDSGNPFVSVSYRAKTWHRHPGTMTFEHRDKKGRPFFGTLNKTAGWKTVWIEPDGVPAQSFTIQPGTGHPFNKARIGTPTLWTFEPMAVSPGYS